MVASKNKQLARLSPEALSESLVEILNEVLFKDLDFSHNHTFYIAFSGGMDSCVLLALMAEIAELRDRERGLIKLKALHFNHGLQSESDAWAKFCQEFCVEKNVPISVSSFKAESIKIDSKQGIEASARSARYAWFKEQIKGDDTAVVLTGHHANDQAETVLFNLIRGGGVSGLRGISMLNQQGDMTLVRPLLKLKRELLEKYAKHSQLNWIEDPSNLDLKFSRNQLRHSVVPTLIDVKEEAVQQIVAASEHMAEAELLLTELAKQDMQNVECLDYCPLDGSYAINLNDLKLLSEQSQQSGKARVKNLLKYWSTESVPINATTRVYESLLSWVEGSVSPDSLIEFGEYCFRYHRGFAYLMPIKSSVEVSEHQLHWQSDEPLILKELGVQLVLESRATDAMDNQVELEVLIGCPTLKGASIKKKFQAAGVPQWRKSVTPVIKMNDGAFICLPYEKQRHGFKMKAL